MTCHPCVIVGSQPRMAKYDMSLMCYSGVLIKNVMHVSYKFIIDNVGLLSLYIIDSILLDYCGYKKVAISS